MEEVPVKEEAQKKYSKSTIIITAIAVIIILVLAFLFYYLRVLMPPVPQESVSVVRNTKTVVQKKPSLPQVVPTSIIKFFPPETLPAVQKDGYCFAGSTAQPFRQDAFRCMVANSIYDPCFTISSAGFVYCQTGIDESTGFLIKLTKALPQAPVPATAQDNWGWFVKLRDGTVCSPFTGTRPFLENNQVAYYGCRSNDKNQQIDLLGDLAKGDVWTANKAILTKSGAGWVISSVRQVYVDTVWQ